MNPPYGEIKNWIQKAYEESEHCVVVALIPARTDTRWFWDYIYEKPGVSIQFIKGRVKFIQPGMNKSNSAPFPSMIVVFDRKSTTI